MPGVLSLYRNAIYKELRGFLKGINTEFKREKDRI